MVIKSQSRVSAMSDAQVEARRTLTIQDFSGFYESIHSSYLENGAIEPFQNDAGDDCAPEAFHSAFHFTNEMLQAYCEKYIEALKEYLGNEHGLKVESMRFNALISPAFYNFTTDRLMVSLTVDEIQALYQKVMADTGPMKAVLKEELTPRSGFVPFYSNELADWLKKDVRDWDANELGMLLKAAADGGWNDIEVLESQDPFHEKVSDVLANHMPKEADAIIARWYEEEVPA